MATIVQTLKVEIEGKIYQVAGASFWEMLDAVKAIEGRHWDGDRKLWELPTLKKEEVLALLEENYQLLGDEDEVLDAETSEIEKILNLTRTYATEIGEEADRLWSQVKSYSYRSKSRIKAGVMRDSGCLQGAIAASKKSVDELTEPEVRVMRKALELIGKL